MKDTSGVRSYVFILIAIFAVLTFAVELVPPPTGKLLQLFTSLFLTMALLLTRRHGTITFICLIVGFLDALYTGLPIALFLFLIRGGTFDLLIFSLKVWKGDKPHLIKISIASGISSIITGLAAYTVVIDWLKIMEVSFQIFTGFIVASTIFSILGAALAVRIWRKLPQTIKNI